MSELRFDGEFCGDWDHDWDSIGAGGGQVFEGWVNADEYEYEYDGQPDEIAGMARFRSRLLRA